MEIKSFPGCCTARIVIGLGNSPAADNFLSHTNTEEELKQELNQAITSARYIGDAVLVAITNDEQKKANKVLREMGWKHSKWMSKETHRNTKVRLWYYIMEE